MKVPPRTVLIVDDDFTLRGALQSALVAMGCRVLTAAAPDTAYAPPAAEPAPPSPLRAGGPVDAVLLDVRLPTMSGLALYLAIVHRWPQLEGRIAVMTGGADAPDGRPRLR